MLKIIVQGGLPQGVDGARYLLGMAGADQGAAHHGVAQHPLQCELRQGLTPLQGQCMQGADGGELLLGDLVRREEGAGTGGAGIRGNARQVAIAQQPPARGEKATTPMPCSRQAGRVSGSTSRWNREYLS